MDITESEEHNFFILFEAVMKELEKVSDIVKGNASILEAKNSIGENVLHYLAIENKQEEVQILRALGSTIPQYSICDALSLGHLDMVALLLELGGDPQIRFCSMHMNNSRFSKKQKYELRGLFRAYGYILEEVQ